MYFVYMLVYTPELFVVVVKKRHASVIHKLSSSGIWKYVKIIQRWPTELLNVIAVESIINVIKTIIISAKY